MPNRRAVIITTTVLVAAIGAMTTYGVWRFLSASPEEVSLDAAVAVVQEQESSGKDGGKEPADLDAGQGITSQPFSQDGAWRVDSDTGTFSFEQSTGSFVGFRVKEELAKIGAITAVGRTGQVEGELSIDEGKLQRVSVTADLSSLVTNDSRRDRAALHALNVKENPTATFTLSQPLELPATDGSEVSLQANGQLTVNGISRNVVVELSAQRVENTIVVVGSTEVIFADYDVAVPSASIVISAEDHGVVEFQLLFVRK